jgi:hypothetical protein
MLSTDVRPPDPPSTPRPAPVQAAAAVHRRRAVARESLVTLIPVGTRYDEVVSRFGRPDEEHERVTPPGRRTLLYRSANGSVHHEVAIEIHDDRVREVTCITSR